MVERPLMFSAPMVRAILAGKKTVTRRPVTWRPKAFPAPQTEPTDHPGAPTYEPCGRTTVVHRHQDGTTCGAPVLRCPALAGDRLWVRETFAAEVPGCEHQGGYSYRADHRDPRGDGPANPMTWTPAIHMPRAASRITLEVVDVRVERLHRIDDEEAAREGIRGWSKDGALWKYAPADAEGDGPCWPWVDCPRSAREAFERLWCEINGEPSWAANPWVWRIEFRRIGGGVEVSSG